MADYITKSDIERIRNGASADDLQRSVDRAKDRSPDGATFLSHSSKDNHLLPAVIRILENHGAIVYVDKRDPTLESNSGREIAKILRSRIKACKKFIVLVTSNIKDSKWVPWELGLSDGSKHIGSTAIFPVVENIFETSWTEQEYLGAYDRIVWGNLNGHKDPLWMVWDQSNNTASTLREWLTRP